MEIKSDALFNKELKQCIAFALQEFGRTTAMRWKNQYENIKRQLLLMPESYAFVPELLRWRKYRGAIIMKNFKIIYFYNEKTDILWFIDLWDMRQNPRKLKSRAKNIEHTNYN